MENTETDYKEQGLREEIEALRNGNVSGQSAFGGPGRKWREEARADAVRAKEAELRDYLASRPSNAEDNTDVKPRKPKSPSGADSRGGGPSTSGGIGGTLVGLIVLVLFIALLLEGCGGHSAHALACLPTGKAPVITRLDKNVEYTRGPSALEDVKAFSYTVGGSGVGASTLNRIGGQTYAEFVRDPALVREANKRLHHTLSELDWAAGTEVNVYIQAEGALGERLGAGQLKYNVCASPARPR